jgi:3-phenylpropionate/cinnamic acid dioxygenase small subunit
MNKVCEGVTPELQLSLEQWYYQEARLLDGRQYQSWLGLCCEDIVYTMPARSNPLVNNREQGNEDMISVERELEGIDSDGCPIRDESYVYLFLRVERSFKMNAWAENPPARTRRIIGNVEVRSIDGEEISIFNNFHLFYSRPGSADFFYAGQRRDTLRRSDGSYKLAHREIIMDMADINVPTLGLFL